MLFTALYKLTVLHYITLVPSHGRTGGAGLQQYGVEGTLLTLVSIICLHEVSGCCVHKVQWYNAVIAFLSESDSACNAELRPFLSSSRGSRVPEL